MDRVFRSIIESLAKKIFKTIENQKENCETFKITNLKLMKMLVIRQERPLVCKLQMNIVQN